MNELVGLDTDQLFSMIRAAYERGYNWGQENPDSRPYLNKAAYDYADKIVGPSLEDLMNDAINEEPK